jgi:uncharacterized protein YegJ (DUF2314 family)
LLLMPSESTVPFSSEDPGMEAAIIAAKQSLGIFLKAFARPTKNQRGFLIKFAYIAGGQNEHIWLADLKLTGKPLRGVVANEPISPGIKFMQPVDFEPAQITDWMFIEDGYLVGGYTTRLIRERMTPDARRTLDASAPYKFREDV